MREKIIAGIDALCNRACRTRFEAGFSNDQSVDVVLLHDSREEMSGSKVYSSNLTE